MASWRFTLSSHEMPSGRGISRPLSVLLAGEAIIGDVGYAPVVVVIFSSPTSCSVLDGMLVGMLVAYCGVGTWCSVVSMLLPSICENALDCNSVIRRTVDG